MDCVLCVECKSYTVFNEENNAPIACQGCAYLKQSGITFYDDFSERIAVKAKKESDPTNPNYYKTFQTEVIDLIATMLTPDEFIGYLKGNIIKYRLRAGWKDYDKRDEDMAKSNWYQDKLFELTGGEYGDNSKDA